MSFSPTLAFSFLSLAFIVRGCEDQEEKCLPNKESIEYEESKLTPDLGVLFTKKVMSNQKGENLYSFIEKTEFFSIKDPETKVEFIPTGVIYGITSRYIKDILSPDKKWVILKTGSVEGLVYAKTENILQSVKNNRFEGRINFEFDYEDDEIGDRLVTDAIGWEAPATFVFYVVDRDTDRKPYPEKEIYKIDLETGKFSYPPQANPVVKPVLRKQTR